MPEVDVQAFYNILIALLGFLGGFLVNSLRESIRELNGQHNKLSDKVQDIEVSLVGGYVTRPDMETLADRLYEKLDRIEKKLDHKQDKTRST